MIVVRIPQSMSGPILTSTFPSRFHDKCDVSTALGIISIYEAALDRFGPWCCSEFTCRPCIYQSWVFLHYMNYEIHKLIMIYILTLSHYIVPVQVQLIAGLGFDDIIDSIPVFHGVVHIVFYCLTVYTCWQIVFFQESGGL